MKDEKLFKRIGWLRILSVSPFSKERIYERGHYDNGDEKEYDTERTEILSEYGLKVIRFKNSEIFDEFETVCAKIKKYF
jgi:hypothetical protein